MPNPPTQRRDSITGAARTGHSAALPAGRPLNSPVARLPAVPAPRTPASPKTSATPAMAGAQDVLDALDGAIQDLSHLDVMLDDYYAEHETAMFKYLCVCWQRDDRRRAGSTLACGTRAAMF